MLYLSVYLLFYPTLQWWIGGWLLANENNEDLVSESTDENVSFIQPYINDENYDIEQCLGTPLRCKASDESASDSSAFQRSVLKPSLVENIYPRKLVRDDTGFYVSEL